MTCDIAIIPIFQYLLQKSVPTRHTDVIVRTPCKLHLYLPVTTSQTDLHLTWYISFGMPYVAYRLEVTLTRALRLCFREEVNLHYSFVTEYVIQAQIHGQL